MMDEIRQRRKATEILVTEDESSLIEPTKRHRRPVVYAIIVLGLLALGLLASHAVFFPDSPIHHHVARFLSMVTSSRRVQDYIGGATVYAIMMDAGSTGSRILVFTFAKSPSDGSLKLLDEFFKEVKPGISSYADNPQQAADSIIGLFNDAKRIIPHEAWRTTPASLKATAGLRLLPDNKADALIQTISDVFQQSGFYVGQDSVSIIDGHSEGLYLWTTINFLLGKLHSDLNETVAVVDMGGGSTQVAFVPLESMTVQNAPDGDIMAIQLLGSPANFYIHSYLGLGLMATRLSVLSRTISTTFPSTSNHFYSECFHPGVNTTWEFQGKQYSIEGTELSQMASEAQLRYALCHSVTTAVVAEQNIYASDEMTRRTLFAVSYYFDRAVEADLISASTGGFVKVEDYCNAAQLACQNPNHEQPFSCIDLTYLCTILEEGFHLPKLHVVNLKKKIDGHETSWALGAALFDLDHKARQSG